MGKATMITFDKIGRYTEYLFKTNTGDLLPISSFEDGVVTVECTIGTSLEVFAETIAGCFNKESNFKTELFKAFGLKADTEFISIQFKLNGVSVVVNQASATPEKICKKWYGRYNMYYGK